MVGILTVLSPQVVASLTSTHLKSLEEPFANLKKGVGGCVCVCVCVWVCVGGVGVCVRYMAVCMTLDSHLHLFNLEDS